MGPRGPSAVKMAGVPSSSTRRRPSSPAAAARARAADGAVAEELQGAGDEFAVEALADEDGGVGAAEVEGAGEDALVPEAVDFAAGGEAVEGWGYAFFGEDFKAPSAAYGHQERPDEARDDGEG
jgi:hypothetical protein